MVAKIQPVVAREGRLILFLLTFLTLTLYFLHSEVSALALLLILLTAMVLYRDPVRRVPSLPLAIVSPVDGVVKSIEKGRDPYLKRDANIITLRKKMFGTGALRSPIEGKLADQWRATGVQAQRDLATWVRTDEGDDIVWMVQGQGVRKPKVHTQPGERAGHGQRCGFQLWAADVKVYIPLNSRMAAKLGQNVRSGSSVLAHLVRKTVSSNLSVESEFTKA